MYLKPKIRRRIVFLSLGYVWLKFLHKRGIGRQFRYAVGMNDNQADAVMPTPSFSRRVASAEAQASHFPYSAQKTV